MVKFGVRYGIWSCDEVQVSLGVPCGVWSLREVEGPYAPCVTVQEKDLMGVLTNALDNLSVAPLEEVSPSSYLGRV
jgi:hypothetical protein